MLVQLGAGLQQMLVCYVKLIYADGVSSITEGLPSAPRLQHALNALHADCFFHDCHGFTCAKGPLGVTAQCVLCGHTTLRVGRAPSTSCRQRM